MFLHSLQWNVDIVFIHGLKGCFFKTWRILPDEMDLSYVYLIIHSLTNQCQCWPQTFLPEYLKAERPQRPLSLRILSVDYPAAMKPSATPIQALSFQQYANFIRKQLERAGVGKRPVVFVVHSMGGIVLKEIMNKEFSEFVSAFVLLFHLQQFNITLALSD